MRHLVAFVSYFPLEEGTALRCAGSLNADGSTTPCPAHISFPFDAPLEGPCILELDHGLSPTAWDDSLTTFSDARAAARCSADDPWDRGIREPAKFLQSMFGIPYDPDLGGGISGARCRLCHLGLREHISRRLPSGKPVARSYAEKHMARLSALGLQSE